MLKEIDTVTKSLQVRGRSLSDCAHNIDVLIDAVQIDKTNATSVFPVAGLKVGMWEGIMHSNHG